MKQPNPNTTDKRDQRDERDQRFAQTLRAALPDGAPSTELRQRIAQMAARADDKSVATTPKRRPMARRARFALAAIGVACALLLFSVMWPRVLTTQAMAQIESAMENVSSAHTVVYEIRDGQRVLHDETWYQNGKWRTQNHERGSTTLWVGGKFWAYDAIANTVTTSDKPGPFAHTPQGSTVAAMTQGMTMEGQKPAVTLLSDAQLNGRTVGRIALVSRTSYETSTLIFSFDKATDLPIRGDVLVRNRYGQEMTGEMEFEFNQPLAPALFEPKFGRGARFIELGRQRKAIGDQLKNAIARQKVGARTIVLRDLQVNKRGDVFVLYTAGKRPDDGFSDRENWFNGRDWKVYLSDSLGTRYHYQRGNYEPEYIEGAWPRRPLYNGERLQGDWWVPSTASTPGNRWQPRTFTLQFEVNPRNLHGKQGTKFPADYSAHASFKVPVGEAQTTLVPAPMKFIGGGLDDERILQIESEARGELPPGALPSPELKRVLIEGEDTYDLQFSPDGQQILTGGEKGARLFEAQSGRLRKQWRGPRGSHADKVVVSPDGETVGANFTTRAYQPLEFALWNAQTLQERARWKWDLDEDQSVASLAVAPDNRTLRVALRRTTKKHDDPDPRVGEVIDAMEVETQQRDLLTGKIRERRVLPHDGFVLEIAQAQSGGKWRVATVQDIRNPRLRLLGRFDGATGAQVANEDVTMLDGRGLAMAAGRVAIGGQIRPRRADGSVDFEAPTEGSQVRTFAVGADKGLHDFPLTGNTFGSAIALSEDGRLIAFEDAGHTISVRDAQNGRTLKTLTGHATGISHLAFAPDGTRLVSADFKGKTFEWKLD